MNRIFVVLAATLLLCLYVAANPIPVAVLSEIQVAPDSEQKLEVCANYYPGIPVDLSGWRIVTRTCTVTVNSGVVIPDTGVYLVLDGSNLSGDLRLNPDGDMLDIIDPCGPQTVEEVSYPGPRGWNTCFLPPRGMSVVPHYYWTGQPGEQILERLWFVESLPSFGQPNPETTASISGRVFNQQAQPVCSAVVAVSGPEGSASTMSQSDGSYIVAWLGPGTFQVTATRYGQIGAYQDSVRVTQHRSRDSIDITIPFSDIVEASPMRFGLDWRGKWLRVSTPEPALVDLRTVSVLGQTRSRLRRELGSGETELQPLSALPSGVYFVQGRIGKESVNRKVTVFK